MNCAICQRKLSDQSLVIVYRVAPENVTLSSGPYYLCAPSAAEERSGLGSPCVTYFRWIYDTEYCSIKEICPDDQRR